MKRSFLLICLQCMVGLLFAQTGATVVLFSEQGERFQVVLNGLLQNEHPQTNVKVQGLNSENYFLKVLFENASIPELDQNFFATPLGAESTYKIKKASSGKYVIRPVSSIPFGGGDEFQDMPTNHQQIVIFNPNALPFGGITTTTTNTNMSTNINMGGVNFSTNVNMNESQFDPNQEYNPVPVETQPVMVYVPGYSGQIGCLMPMDAGSFAQAQQSIKSKSFESDMLKIAKQVVNNNCLTSNQVKEMMGDFSFESSKLEFAKYCWNYTYDIKNYYVINDAFGFSSSIDELNTYMQAHPISKQYGYAGQTLVQTTTPKTPPKTHPINTGVVHNNNAGKCSFPVSDIDFANIKNTVRGQNAEDSKFKVAKQLVGSTCLRSAQIKELLDLLSFERNRLDLAKLCYAFAFDPQSYYLIDNALATKTSRDELEAYILTQK